ncbi:MAG: pilus assembly protein CpaE [Sphingomonadales bacterium]|nr:MAG: pilus assembly protein CpaE [Sphingomonadales bacterium]
MSAAKREPFMAFLNDPETVAAVKPVAIEMGYLAEKLYLGGLANAVQSLSMTTSPQILLVDLAGSHDPLGEIGGLAEVCEPGTIVLALGDVNDVTLYRELLASGIQDYLLKPVHPDTLRDAFAVAQNAFNAPKAVESTEKRQRIVHVVGARGGLGASSIAASLAWQFAEDAEERTAILDLDLHFGVGALAFDVEPGRGLTDALENPARVDSLFVERAIVKISERLAVMSAETPMTMPLLADGNALQHLQEELKSAYDVLVVDMPRSIAVQNPTLIAEATDVVIVTDMTLAATRDTIRLLGFLQSVTPNARLWIVGNRVGASSDLEVTRKDFEASIERPLALAIAYDPKSAALAAKQGKPIVAAAKGTKIAGAMKQLYDMICSIEGAPGKAKKAPGLADLVAKARQMLQPKKSS